MSSPLIAVRADGNPARRYLTGLQPLDVVCLTFTLHFQVIPVNRNPSNGLRL